MTPALASLVQAAERTPLPATPPLEGPLWTVVAPSLLLLVAAIGTWALWRHFADEE